MMNQEVFNSVVTQRIMEFMPPIYGGYEPKVEKINKVNEVKTALMLLPEEKGACVASPMVYLEDMYAFFREDEDLDGILRFMASIFMNNIYRPMEESAAQLDFKKLKSRIVMQLISAERNEELLENLPHTDVIDMAVIYRAIMRFCDDGGFDSIIVNDQVLKEIEIDKKELHALALQNTKEFFEPTILELSPKALMVSNEFQTYGATAMILEDVMTEVGRRLDTDMMYIIPCSIHEFIAVYAEGTDIESLIAMLAEGNTQFTRECDILSNSIYLYNLKEQKISKAATYR